MTSVLGPSPSAIEASPAKGECSSLFTSVALQFIILGMSLGASSCSFSDLKVSASSPPSRSKSAMRCLAALSAEKRAQIVAALVEGNSIRATVRMTGASKNTIAKLLVALGSACSEYLDKTLVNLRCQRVQCDEIWSFVAAKQRNVSSELREKNPYAGDVWTWVAMDADTKLVCSWTVGHRDWATAYGFIQDLGRHMANRIQLTTDGNRMYLFAVRGTFDQDINYAVLMKLYGGNPQPGDTRYSPAVCIGCEKHPKIGDPDPKHISTSFVEPRT